MRIAGDDERRAPSGDGHSCGWLAGDRSVNRENVATDLFFSYIISLIPNECVSFTVLNPPIKSHKSGGSSGIDRVQPGQ